MAIERRLIEARCPVCKESSHIDPEELGLVMECRNCKQGVKLVPRSSGQRARRSFLKLVIVAGGVWLCVTLYSCREEAMTKALGGVELPDISKPNR